MIKSVLMFDMMSHSSLSFGPILVHLSPIWSHFGSSEFCKRLWSPSWGFWKKNIKFLHYKTRCLVILQILVWEKERWGCRWGRWIKENKKKNILFHRLSTFYSDLYRCSYNEVLTYIWDVLVILKQGYPFQGEIKEIIFFFVCVHNESMELIASSYQYILASIANEKHTGSLHST